MENKLDNIQIGDYTLKQWEEKIQAPPVKTSMSFAEAEEMGLLAPNEPQPQEDENQLYNTLDQFGIEHPDAGKQYEKLGAWDTTKDVLASLGTEASHILMPKDMELQYESKTKFGENVKYGYRYLAGTAGFMAGGWGVAGIKGLANLGRLGTFIQKAGKLVGGVDIIKTGAKASKAAQIGAKIANASLGGAVAGALADFNLYRPEENEGHLLDAFGHVDNALVTYLQSSDSDTDIDAKLKNVVEGLVLGMGMGNLIEFGAKPLFKTAVKNIKAFRDGKAGAAEAMAQDQIKLERFATKADLIETVEKIKAEADANGADASQMLIDRLHPEDNIEAQEMLKVLNEGEEIFLHSDGTWDISVRSWDEAHKVSPEEYKKQSLARDEAAGGYAGDTAISHQDAAVKHTWTNRGWMGENDNLVTQTPKGAKGNTKLANSITKNYKDKWQIDNNIKVEFVDGLKVKGQAVEGTTSKTTYEGKTTKTNQNAIDKKKLQIQKIKDKITMAEGGNAEVTDPLDVLKEELRIANNELKELQKAAKGENKIPNITIKIDVNAKNPYATLRAELEHARDIAKKEVPKDADVVGSGTHFARYTGDNEGEVAAEYVYKKSAGKAKTQGQDVVIKENNEDVVYIQGAKSKKLKLGEYDVTIDYDIADNIQKLNDLGYKTGQSHSGKISDHPYTGTTEDGHGYISFYKKDLTDEQIKNLKLAAEKAGVRLVEDDKLFFQPAVSIRTARTLDGTFYEDLLQQANKEAGLDKEGWGMNALQQRDQRLRELVQEHGGLNLDDAVIQKQWDDFTTELEKLTNPPVNPQQLKLDFSQKLETKQTPEEVVNGLVNGEIKPLTKGDVEALVNKVAQTDPDIAGFNWKDVIENPEKYMDDIERIFTDEDASGLIEAIAKGDINTLSSILQREKTAVTIWGELHNVVKNKGLDIADDAKVAIIDTIHHLAGYVKGVKTGLATGLEGQKGINKLLEEYGASRLSSWTKEGLDVFASKMIDALNDIINLNFTRGQKLTPQQVREQLAQTLLKNPETHEFTRFILTNKDIMATFTTEIEKLLKKNGGLTIEEAKAALKRTIMLPEYNAQFKAAQLAPDKQGFWNTIKNWCDGNGGLTSYYVHNLLSGAGSLAKNIGSGLVNTFYFPAKKILASYDMFLDADSRLALRNEGWNTYKNMLVSCKESWQLMKEAFITGNGKLTDIGEQTLNMDNGRFKGFHELKNADYYFQDPKQFWEGLQNFHSIMTRAMGATDEFMSQLNYRSIVRSKALNEASRIAEAAGKAGDESFINEEAQRIFTTKFDKHGKPTDVEALNEARTILYQNNLDGTMYNYQTRAKEKMRDTTFVMELAGNVQHYANKNAFMKCMFPFVKTGANILQMALDHNAIYMAASPAQRKLLMANTAEGAVARSQCAFGMFSLGIGAMLAFNGAITGSAPSDPKERKALFATGWRPYSFKWGDTYISYQGYEPIHGMLGFAADCANMWSTVTNPDDEKRIEHFTAQIMPTLVNNFLDKAAFRTGLKQLDLIMNPKDSEEWSKAMAQTFKGFLPDVAMVTNMRSVGEHDVMQPQTMYERVFHRYFPNLWQPKDYRRNVFGEKQSITGLLITSVGSQDGTPEEEALEYLAKYGYSPSEIDDVIANTGLKISDFKDPETGRSAMDAMKEEMSVVTIQGQTLREALRDLVTSEEYLSLPDGVDLDTGARWGAKEDTKINAVNSIFLLYKQKAKKNVMADMDYYVDSQGRTIEDATEEIQLKRLEHLNNLY